MTDSSITSDLDGGLENRAVVITPPSVTPDPSPERDTTSQRKASERRVEKTLDRLETLSDELAVGESKDQGRGATGLPYALPPDFRLSVVVPVYNERETIEEILERVRALPLPLEIVAVDDCSQDGTGDVLRAMESRGDVRAVFQPRNQGKGAALRAGFELATGDVIVVQDADLEYDPQDILRLLEPVIKGEADVVYGSRFLEDRPAGSSWLHQFGNGLLTATSNLTTGLKLTDMETCYKLFRREVLHGLSLAQNRYGFEPEITAKIARRGFRVRELPIGYDPRSWDEGKKIGIRDAFSAFYCIVRYAWAD